jgi:hypothetical protein
VHKSERRRPRDDGAKGGGCDTFGLAGWRVGGAGRMPASSSMQPFYRLALGWRFPQQPRWGCATPIVSGPLLAAEGIQFGPASLSSTPQAHRLGQPGRGPRPHPRRRCGRRRTLRLPALWCAHLVSRRVRSISRARCGHTGEGRGRARYEGNGQRPARKTLACGGGRKVRRC